MIIKSIPTNHGERTSGRTLRPVWTWTGDAAAAAAAPGEERILPSSLRLVGYIIRGYLYVVALEIDEGNVVFAEQCSTVLARATVWSGYVFYLGSTLHTLVAWSSSMFGGSVHTSITEYLVYSVPSTMDYA